VLPTFPRNFFEQIPAPRDDYLARPLGRKIERNPLPYTGRGSGHYRNSLRIIHGGGLGRFVDFRRYNQPVTASTILAGLEARLFESINEVVEPAVRAGWGAPGLVPAGLIVLETKGRVSGRTRRVPAMASGLNGYLLVATYRGDRSQWIKNLAAQSHVRYWIGGVARDAKVFVFDGRDRKTPDELCWLQTALAASVAVGWAFAVLRPSTETARPSRRPQPAYKKPGKRAAPKAGSRSNRGRTN
jgi:hypothetical protein